MQNKLLDTFKERRLFDKNELYEFYVESEPDLNERTLDWRIHNLRKKDIIKTVGHGLYTISEKPEYVASPSHDALKIARKLTRKFEKIDYCISESQWINEFSKHQSFNNIILVEIEREFVQSLYYYLIDNLYKNVYLKPNDKEIQYYISGRNNTIVIQNLISRSPKRKLRIRKTIINVASLEKLMVDLFSKNHLFYFYDGSEIIYIYESILNTYNINFSKLLSYAKRRKNDQKIKQLMLTHLPNSLYNVINDR